LAAHPAGAHAGAELSTRSQTATHATPALPAAIRATPSPRLPTALLAEIVECRLLRCGEHGTRLLTLPQRDHHLLVPQGTEAIEGRTSLREIAVALHGVHEVGLRP
jgi:hypothetical protein